MQKLSFLDFNQLVPIWSFQEISNLCSMMNKKHSVFLNEERFEILAGENKSQIQIQINLKKNDGTCEYPIECVFINENKEENAQKIASLMLDYIDIYWTNYFQEDRDVFIPIDWNPHEYEGISFHIRGSIRKKDLEIQADQFLAQYGHGNYDIQSLSSET